MLQHIIREFLIVPTYGCINSYRRRQESTVPSKAKNFEFFITVPKVAYPKRLYGTKIMRIQEI
jgi:hypothetical protein